MIRTLPFHSVFRMAVRLSTAVVLFISFLPAQVDPYQSYPQTRQSDDEVSAPGNSDSCSQPENASAPECSQTISGRDSYRSNDMQRLPSNLPNQRLYGRPGLQQDLQQDDLDNLTSPQKSRFNSPQYRVVEPPNEFQRFVQSSIGKLLPIYGASLFNHVPSTFAPVDHVPVTPDYTVGPGDEVDLRVWGQINFSHRLIVDRSGDVFVPQVGRISLAGIRYQQLQDTLRSGIGRVFKNFDLSANMGQLRSIQIFVAGQARRPGSYTVSSLSTLVNALFASGGPSSHGSLRDIQLKREGKVVTTFDLYSLLLRGDKSKDVSLLPGDVIFIPSAGPRVAIAGSVENPAIYEVKPNTTLVDVLTYSGGLSPVAGGQRAILQRVSHHEALRSDLIQLNEQGLSTVLADADIVRLLPVVPQFERTVTLKGNVADPVRVPWHEGMKVSDLIPERRALLTRSYWRERNQLTQEDIRQNDKPLPVDGRSIPVGKTGSQLDGADQRSDDEETRTARRIAYQDESQNTSEDSSLAAALSPSKTLKKRQFTQQNDVQPSAPDINWSYAVIERLDERRLTTRLIPFNLGKVVLEHDAGADQPLEAGDVVTIFSNADIETPRALQSGYVRIEGEVNMAGVYSIHPGETLRDLVAQAGGLSPNAYLFGAQLTRESTRKEQQKRYNEFVDSLERDVNQSAATLAGRVISAQQDQALQASISSQRALVERLRKTPATGRIVLDLEPDSNRVETIPAIPLENGDKFIVPSAPSTVNVVGTVYNQSAFVYARDLRLGDYLREAGGPTRYADRGHIFVIRADGSVIAKETHSGLFTASFDTLRMYPGDTLVVPTNVTKTTRLRGFLDWSQVISNFGIGVAAINVLK